MLATLNRIEQIDYHLNKAIENGLTQEELVAADPYLLLIDEWRPPQQGRAQLSNLGL